MDLTPDRLREIREWGVFAHREWKRRSWTSDLISRGDWNVIWPDLTIGSEFPLVENIYIEALEDKAATAASLSPRILVAPSKGTRADRGEEAAQKKRRAFVSTQQRSNIDQHLIKWYLDWWQHGARYSLPWTYWDENPRYPYILRMDPRQAYPLAHDSLGNLTAIFFARSRRLIDLQREWGENHPALYDIVTRRSRDRIPLDTPVEELWYYDNEISAVAVHDDSIPGFTSQFRYVSPIHAANLKIPPRMAWLVEPYEHKLDGCPVIENRRHSVDGEYRGALDVMIPNLRVAQNLTARMLDDIEMYIYAPVLFEGIINPEMYGPGSRLIGDGTGNAKVEYARPPSTFDASIHVAGQMDAARNVARYPQQRQGEFGASIASAKGVTSVMGSFNTEIAWAQRDQAIFLQQTYSRAANFDEMWCGGSKEITGYDEGELYTDKYNPETLWKGDYRVHVTFGGGLGMDQNGYLLTLGTAKNLEGLGKRSFMAKSGLVDNPLTEEREIVIETITDGFLAFALKQADEAQNVQPLLDIAEEIDDESISARQAILKVVKRTQTANAPGGPPGGGPPGGGMATPPGMDQVLAQRSLASGGQPGTAEGLPPITSDLSNLMPPQALRAATEMGPGGTAA